MFRFGGRMRSIYRARREAQEAGKNWTMRAAHFLALFAYVSNIAAYGSDSIDLQSLRGRVVYLDFWASWCAPCIEETPSLNELQRRIASRGGMVLGVSEDDDQQAYDEFLKARQVIFPTFRDTTKQIPAQYGTSMYPDTYVIGRDGKLDRKIVGPQDWTSSEMTVYLDSLLDAK